MGKFVFSFIYIYLFTDFCVFIPPQDFIYFYDLKFMFSKFLRFDFIIRQWFTFHIISSLNGKMFVFICIGKCTSFKIRISPLVCEEFMFFFFLLNGE